MSTTPRQVRAALADALREISGLQVSDYIISNPTAPCAEVRRGPVDYDQAFQHGLHVWTMYIRVYVSAVSDRGSATLLDAYLAPDGASSVKAAVEADTTLGGLVQDLHCATAAGEQAYALEGMPALLGSEWTVTVYA